MPEATFETLADGFSHKGVAAHSPASILGKSGISHEFAFAAIQDSGKPWVVVDTELSVKEVDEMKVLKFYVKVYDVDPDRAVLCVSPKLSTRAASLAKDYGITVIEDDIPKRLIPKVERVIAEVVS